MSWPAQRREKEEKGGFMRLLALFFALSVFVYYLAGRPGKYSRRQRLLYALLTFVALYAVLLATVIWSGDPP